MFRSIKKIIWSIMKTTGLLFMLMAAVYTGIYYLNYSVNKQQAEPGPIISSFLPRLIESFNKKCLRFKALQEEINALHTTEMAILKKKNEITKTDLKDLSSVVKQLDHKYKELSDIANELIKTTLPSIDSGEYKNLSSLLENISKSYKEVGVKLEASGNVVD